MLEHYLVIDLASEKVLWAAKGDVGDSARQVVPEGAEVRIVTPEEYTAALNAMFA